jgi:hypothetical protein
MDDGECIRMTGFDLVIIYNDILKKIELELIVNFHGLYFKMVCILNQILDSTFNINLTRKLDWVCFKFILNFFIHYYM